MPGEPTIDNPFGIVGQPAGGLFGASGWGGLSGGINQTPVPNQSLPPPETPAGYSGMSVPKQPAGYSGITLPEPVFREPPKPAPTPKPEGAKPVGLFNDPPGGVVPGGGQPSFPGMPNLDLGAVLENYGPRGLALKEMLDMLYRKPTGGGPAKLIKGGEVQTGRSVQNALGPKAETIKAYLQNQSDSGTLGAAQGLLESKGEGLKADSAKERQAIEDKEIEANVKNQELFKQRQKNLFGAIDTLQNQIGNKEIDSNRFWKNTTTGDKVAAVFATLFSAVGGAMAGGQENLAMRKLEQAVDNDVRDQIQNIDKQRKDLTTLQSLYGQAREALGDDRAAAALVKEQALRSLASDLDSKMGGIKSQQAVVRGEQLRGQIMKEALLQKAEWEKALLGTQTTQYAMTPDKIIGGGTGGISEKERWERFKWMAEHGYKPELIEASLKAHQMKGNASNLGTIVGPDGVTYQRPPNMGDEQWKTISTRIAAANQTTRLLDQVIKEENSNLLPAGGFKIPFTDTYLFGGERKARDMLSNQIAFNADQFNIQGQTTADGLNAQRDATTGAGAKKAAQVQKQVINTGVENIVNSYGLKPLK